MGSGQVPLLAALSDKMRWYQQRQTVLSENVANAETPGYRAHDLKAYAFRDHLRGGSLAMVTTSSTSPAHISVSSTPPGGFGTGTPDIYETIPRGTQVNLEDEMMKVTANQMDYQTITTLYTRSLRLIRTALGKA